jgi:NAD(P)-dependent dehydrogenase (short-subunit alcohol dehydrogenase family)
MGERAAFRHEQPTVLITGASRGLGLEFARQYAEAGWNVMATCRNPAAADGLRELAAQQPRLVVEALDVTSDVEVSALAARYAGKPIDVLLNNAGIYGTLTRQALGAMDFAEAMRVFDVNALGPLRVTQAFLDNVAASRQKKVVSLGGGLGAQSIGSQFGGHYAMKMSKAAHMISMGTLQTEVRERDVIVVMISPGRVDTRLMRDSGWTGPVLSATDSAAFVIARIAVLDAAACGRLITFDGQVIPW